MESLPAVLRRTTCYHCVTSSPSSLIAYAWWCRCIYLLIRSICIRQIIFFLKYSDIRGNRLLENTSREAERYHSFSDIPHRPLITLYHGITIRNGAERPFKELRW